MAIPAAKFAVPLATDTPSNFNSQAVEESVVVSTFNSILYQVSVDKVEPSVPT